MQDLLVERQQVSSRNRPYSRPLPGARRPRPLRTPQLKSHRQRPTWSATLGRTGRLGHAAPSLLCAQRARGWERNRGDPCGFSVARSVPHSIYPLVIDTPPLNVVTDAAIIGSRVDGVLLVARSGVTERDTFRHALDQLQAVRARVLGCVLNDSDVPRQSYYGGRAADYYGRTALTR